MKNEMQWTLLWFQKKAKLWRERSEQKGGDLPLGHKSYATKKQKLWNAFQKKAKERFGIYLE